MKEEGMEESNFEIIFYEDNKGEIPVKDFIDSLNGKMRAKVALALEQLSIEGNYIREPYSKHLEDGIFELRVKVSNNQLRILYFFFIGKRVVLTNGFIKKKNSIDRKHIKLAKKRRNHYIERSK